MPNAIPCLIIFKRLPHTQRRKCHLFCILGRNPKCRGLRCPHICAVLETASGRTWLKQSQRWDRLGHWKKTGGESKESHQRVVCRGEPDMMYFGKKKKKKVPLCALTWGCYHTTIHRIAPKTGLYTPNLWGRCSSLSAHSFLKLHKF